MITLANHISHRFYGIAERLPVAAPPGGGRSRTRAQGSEQDGRLGRSDVWRHCLKLPSKTPRDQPRNKASSVVS